MIKLQISMRKIDFVLTAAAAMMFVGCVNDDNVANVGGEVASQKDATIGFNLTVPGQTRATLSGKDAADKLNNEFVVFGTKHTEEENGTADNDQNVFTNYKVRYTENTVGTTETNTHNWEYVGESPYEETKVSPKTTSQTVKYWDYSATKGYTFTAFAAQGELANSHVTITKVTADPATGEGTTKSKYKKGYTVAATKDAKLDSIFYSDRVEVPVDNYGKPVTMTFRNFGSRVRVGFYETVPGYTVKIDTFYYDNDATQAVTTYSAMSDKSTSEFKAALWNVNKEPKTGEGESGTNILTVTYYADGSVLNQPTVTNTTCTYTPTLKLGSGLTSASLATSSSEPTWDSTKGAYTTVFPNEGCSNPMLIRCDYTLTAEDGSNETIKVKNARVVVPAEYMKWKPNFTYTYLFKISDKTNGTTGTNPSNPDEGDEHEGLHPITFDAVVVDATTGNQEYVATVSTNNVITYANGSEVTTNAEYKAGEVIYVVNQSTKANNHSVIKPTAIGTSAGQAQVYKLGKAATESEVYAQLNGSKMGITMNALSGTDAASIVTAVPLADGTNATIDAVKFTPAAITGTSPEYYAYVYTTTAYEAPEYESAKGATYNNSTVYYFRTANSTESANDGVYYTASGISEANFGTYKSQLYTVKSDKKGTVGVYDIKVITVKQ